MPTEPDLKMWLKPEDLLEKTVLEILTPHRKLTPEETGLDKTVYEIDVKLPDGKERTFTLSGAKYRAIVTHYGDNSDDWVNKKITVNKVKMSFKGELIDAIVVPTKK